MMFYENTKAMFPSLVRNTNILDVFTGVVQGDILELYIS